MAKVGDKTENYFDEAYWNNRYTRDAGSFDWYQHYRGIAPLIKMYAKLTDAVLMVGCGSARMRYSLPFSFQILIFWFGVRRLVTANLGRLDTIIGLSQ